MYEHAYHLDFGANAAVYVDQVMANLNWQRIGARYRLAVGDRAEQDELFLPFGAPAQEEARISAEELKVALENDDDRRPVLLDLCLPRDLPRRNDMLARGLHARTWRPIALGRRAATMSADRCLLYLRISGQW
jgi:Fe-Mn family superoxide dismutase